MVSLSLDPSVDFSGEALIAAQERAAERHASVDWIRADVTQWEPDHKFDLITMAYLHFPGAPGPKDPAVLYTPQLLIDAIGPVLTIRECHTVQRDGAHDPEVPGAVAPPAIDTFLDATH